MQYRPRGEARLEALELARLGTRRTAVSSESLGVQLPQPLRLTWGQNVTRRVLIWVRIKGLVRRRLRNFRSGGETTSVIIKYQKVRGGGADASSPFGTFPVTATSLRRTKGKRRREGFRIVC